jgi:hypothetical protein
MIWKYIKADAFFVKYCPDIKSYKHKIRGKNGRGNPVNFSDQESKEIKNGLKRLFRDMTRGKP